MPLIIPDDIEQFTTPGEEIFSRFLRRVAKPDERYIVWYSPDITDAEPDFILYNPEIGLIVFEVKDWTIEQIREATPKKFKLLMGSKEIAKTNPLEQEEQNLNYLGEDFPALEELKVSFPERYHLAMYSVSLETTKAPCIDVVTSF
jgi:hypothetical protein